LKFQGGLGPPASPSDDHDYYVTFQPQFTTSKCCARGSMSPLAPWLRHCLKDRIISLLEVVHTANILKLNQATKTVMVTYTSKQKP